MRRILFAACAAALMSLGIFVSPASADSIDHARTSMTQTNQVGADPLAIAGAPVEMQQRQAAAGGPFQPRMSPARNLTNCQVVRLTDGRSFKTAIRINGPLYHVGIGPGCPSNDFIGGTVIDSRTVRLSNGMTCRASGPTVSSVWCG